MNEVNKILLLDLLGVFSSLDDRDRERLADIGRGILLASGIKDADE